MIATLDFKAPADLVEEAEKEVAAAPMGLVGTWKNCDPATRGLVRIDIAAGAKGTTLHAFGACHPTPCDWGTMPAFTYAANVSAKPAIALTANYKFGFKETILTGTLNLGYLIVESFNHFTDGSGRTDYYSKDYFRR